MTSTGEVALDPAPDVEPGPRTAAFDRATAVGSADGPDGAYPVTLDAGWAIGDKPHGGYLVALLARAAGRAVAAAGAPHPHPLTTSTLFLRAASFGPAHVVTEVRRIGRAVSHVHSILVQDGVACVESMHAFGTLADGAVPWFADDPPVDLPAWGDCLTLPRNPVLPDGTPLRVGIAEFTDVRVDPTTSPLVGSPSAVPTGPTGAGPATAGRPDRAELQAWLAFADDRDHDPLSLLFVLDALPPVTFALGLPGWVPTIELTAYVRALPAPGPLRVRQRARLIQDGRLDEVCDVWDSTGRLVAQATQLAGIRLPD